MSSGSDPSIHYVHVNALRAKGTQVSFQCPYCWSKYDKYDEPTRAANPIIHEHGINSDDGRTQVLYRMPHCKAGRFPKGKFGFAIHVIETTPWAVR